MKGERFYDVINRLWYRLLWCEELGCYVWTLEEGQRSLLINTDSEKEVGHDGIQHEEGG